MNGKARIIVNPYAGRWKAWKSIPAIETALRREGIAYDLVQTEGEGHGIELARQAAVEGYAPVVAAGGDGTVSEVMNGLVQAAGEGLAGPMGIIPLGSANDLPVQLGLPLDIEGACRCLREGRERVIDVGRVDGRYFDNDVGVGFEPQVTIEARKIKRLRGTLIYIVAVFRALRRYEQPHMTIAWDDGRAAGRMLLVSVGNGNVTGGAFRLTPQAELDDGLLDFVFGTAMSRLQVLRFLPLVFSGQHIHRPEVTYGRTRRLTITSDDPLPVGVDGEIISTAAHRLEFEVIPHKLRVIC
ncbi:MAG: diacylglycerol kinase family lipid kinase [Anaerolineae bacterium]|nr:diacylglycerol kinase family lipid kinase [Anaerolineae bacterium]